MTPNNYEVSVIIPMHNGQEWINASIDSVLTQTANCEIEVIVVDDGSTDRSVEVVRSYRDSRVRLLTLDENVGVCRARNLGLQEARLNWIAFNDADDLWLPDRLSMQFKLLSAFPECGGCVGGNARLSPDGRSQWMAKFGPWQWTPVTIPHLAQPPYYNPWIDGHVYLASLIARRDVALATCFDPSFYVMEDLEFLYRLSNQTTLLCVQEPVFLYRLSHVSTTSAEKLDASNFLRTRAFLYTTADCHNSGRPLPSRQEFYAGYEPSKKEINELYVAQAMRRVNTIWVNRGIFPAAQHFLASLARYPVLFTRLFVQRLKRWARM